MKCISTRQAATLVGIDRSTIQKWIRLGRVDAARVTFQGRRRVRCWDKKGLAQLRELTRQWDFKQNVLRVGHAVLQVHKDRWKKEQQEKRQKAITTKVDKDGARQC